MHWLKADDELRRVFGSRTVAGDDRDSFGMNVAGSSRRIRRLAARGLLRRTYMLKSGKLIEPKDYWPPIQDLGLSMEIAGCDPVLNVQQFKIVHSQSYRARQELFEECQSSFDPNAMANFLRHHPYHLDALLTMHDLYRSMGEAAAADELLAKCVYACEMAWHPAFTPSSGNVSVLYNNESASMFVALFKWIQSLSRRCLHRTALENAKLLLAMDQESDPQGVTFLIDYVALAAGAYDFIEKFSSICSGVQPSIAFSGALALWYDSNNKNDASRSALASERLSDAIQMFPIAVVRMLKKLGKEKEYECLLQKPPFSNAETGNNASLSHLVDIFVERHHALWQAQAVLAWLIEVSGAVDAEKDNLRMVRVAAFPPNVDENEYGHLKLYDFSDTVHRIPVEEMHGMGQNIHGQQEELRRVAGRNLTEEELQDANPLLLLLQTMLPWIHVDDDPMHEREAGNDNG